MDAQLSGLLAKQHEQVARWQLLDREIPPRVVDRALAHLRPVHSGVWTTTRGALTERQRQMAATLTAPGTILAFSCAGALHGCMSHGPQTQLVIRKGTGGPQQMKGRRDADDPRELGIRVWFTGDLDATVVEGIPVVPCPRTLLDLAPTLGEKRLRRAVLEALRLRCCVRADLLDVLERRKGVRGCVRLRRIVDEVEDLPIAGTRSNAEAEALHRDRREGGQPPDQVNVIVEGFEADRVWRDLRLIEEIDGPGFHLDPIADARKEAAWEAAGWTVVRRASDDVYRA